MIPTDLPFNTGKFFAGGSGLFLQYHDVVKPVYLYAIIKMILTKTTYGLPLNIISSMSVFSLIEWYLKRRNPNPLLSLDYRHILDPKELDSLLLKILNEDSTLYSLAPPLNIKILLSQYKKQHMTFPIYVYTKEFETNIENDIRNTFPGLPVKYLYGDLKKVISICSNNFTYILSDIELLKSLTVLLSGKWSHLLLSKEYMYNYKDNYKTLKQDLRKLILTYPFYRIGITSSLNLTNLFISCSNTILGRTLDDSN